MKKSIALLALAFGVTGAFAQDLTSKKGEPFLPEADDWSIGIDATPFLDYAGNFFGKTTKNNAPTWNYLTNNMTITGRMMKDAQTAYRASVRLGFGGATERKMVADRMNDNTTNSYPATDNMVENSWKRSKTNIGIAVGIEKRRGKTRLQGIYGAEVGFGISTTKDKFKYGNTLNPNATSPLPNVVVTGADGFTSDLDNDGTISAAETNFNLGDPGITGITPTTVGRMTQMKSGMGFSFGVRAFIGAEYFVAPKVSIGGEFGWGVGLSTQGVSKTSYESTGTANGATTPSVGTTDVKGAKGMSFALDTDGKNSMFGPSGALRLNFYF